MNESLRVSQIHSQLLGRYLEELIAASLVLRFRYGIFFNLILVIFVEQDCVLVSDCLDVSWHYFCIVLFMTNFQEHFLESCDTNTLGSELQGLEVGIEQLKELF